MTKNAKIVWQQKKVPPAIIPEKAIILHTLEDAGMYIYIYQYIYIYISISISIYNYYHYYYYY